MNIRRGLLIASPILIAVIAFLLLNSSILNQQTPTSQILAQPGAAQTGLNASQNATNASKGPIILINATGVPNAGNITLNASNSSLAPAVKGNTSNTTNSSAVPSNASNATAAKPIVKPLTPSIDPNLICARSQSQLDWTYISGNASRVWKCGFSDNASGTISYTTFSHSGKRAVNITMNSTGVFYYSQGSLYSYYTLPPLDPGHYHLSVWLMSPTNAKFELGLQQLSDWSFTDCVTERNAESQWELFTCDGTVTQKVSQGYILPIVLESVGTLVWDDLTLTQSNSQYGVYTVQNFTV